MTIYAILTSIPHNHHYVKRYVSFIEGCQKVNEDYTGYTEKHHICPKSLFPEYKSFSKHPWNKVVLTARQHVIAHWILWKVYPDSRCMQRAFYLLTHNKRQKIDSRTFAKLTEEHRKIQTENLRQKVENGTHPFLGDGEYQRNVQKKRIEDGTHNFLDSDYQRNVQKKRVEDGTHHFLGGEIARKRVEDGTHHFLGGELQRKRIEDGTHPFLGGEMQRRTQRKIVEDGNHHCSGVVACYDREGIFIMIPKEEYRNQIGPKEGWEYLSINSKEARARKVQLPNINR
jgi:hypothetical protein